MSPVSEKAALSLNSINDAIRDNPLAAGIIGAGIAWMLVGKFRAPSISALAQPFEDVSRSIKSAAVSGTQALRDGAQAASSFVSEGLSSATESAASLVPHAGVVSAAGQSIKTGVSNSAEVGKQYASSIQRTLSESLERQPIMLGAIGLAIGAGIAAAFPSTQIENELMGEQATAARDKISAVVSDVKDAAEDRAQKVVEVLSDTKDQLKANRSAGEVLNKVSQKASKVTGAAQESLKNRLP